MIIILFIAMYIIGCIFAYLMVAYENDKYNEEKTGWFYVIFSWVTVIFAPILYILIKLILSIPKHPTLKSKKK